MFIYWPIFLVVFSNIFYHVCAKLAPQNMHPLLMTALSYIIGAVIALALYFCMHKPSDFMQELRSTNWAVILFAIAIIGLEMGNIYMYKIGWQINTGYLIQSCLLAVALLIVGYTFFKEPITFTKALGTLICLIGLYFINR